MIDAFNNSLSGLSAASRAIAAHANNLAHISATGSLADNPFRLVDAVMIVRGDSKVQAALERRDPSSVASFQPDKPYANGQGLVALANVDPAAELVGLMQSRAQFLANLRALGVADEVTGFLIDTKA